MPRVGHTGTAGSANMMMYGTEAPGAVHGFPDGGVQGKYRTVVSVTGDDRHGLHPHQHRPQGHGQAYPNHVQASSQGHHPRNGSHSQQAYPVYDLNGYPGSGQHFPANTHPKSPQEYVGNHPQGYPENGDYNSYPSHGHGSRGQGYQQQQQKQQQSYGHTGNGHHTQATNGQGHAGNGYSQEYYYNTQGYSGYDEIYQNTLPQGYQQTNGSLPHGYHHSKSPGSTHQGYTGNGYPGHQGNGHYTHQHQPNAGKQPVSPCNGYHENGFPGSPESIQYGYEYDEYANYGDQYEYSHVGSGYVPQVTSGGGSYTAQTNGKSQAYDYYGQEVMNGTHEPYGEPHVSNGVYHGVPSPGMPTSPQGKDPYGYGKQNGHIVNGHVDMAGSNGYRSDPRTNGLKSAGDSVKSTNLPQNGLNGSSASKGQGHRDTPSKQDTLVKAQPLSQPPPPPPLQMPKQTFKSAEDVKGTNERDSRKSEENLQSVPSPAASQNCKDAPITENVSNNSNSRSAKEKSINSSSAEKKSSNSSSYEKKNRNSNSSEQKINDAKAPDSKASSSSSEQSKASLKQIPSPVSRQMKELGKDIENYYKERFYMNENSPKNPKEAQSGEGKKGPHDEEHPFFVVGRDIRKPDTLREHKIISSKGTVRGFKNRVRAGIATFLDQDKSKIEDIVEKYSTSHNFLNYREKEKGKIVVYTTSMRIVRDTYENCVKVKNILHTHMVKYEEKDIFMSRENQRELLERLGDDTIEVPQVFADGVHLGGADQMEVFNESGELRRIFKHFKRVTNLTSCTKCGGYSYIPCMTCHGSKKSLHRNHFTEEFCALRCITCDENGLVRCDLCKDEGE